MLARLGSFLRMTLDLPLESEHSLRQELAFTRSYLAIEQVRFRDRLRVEEEVDEALLDARVPVLLLQPLVENALRHGISHREGSGLILVRARRGERRLCLEVLDDGPGCDPARLGTGIGTANTLARLHQLFGEDQRFLLRDAKGQGTLARVEFPLRWDREGSVLRSGAVT